MPDSDSIIANTHWEACKTCKYDADAGCAAESEYDPSDFKYIPAFDGFVCELYTFDDGKGE